MRTNFAQKRTMLTAVETMDRARPIAVALVDREQRQSLSRRVAYGRVALRIGVSVSWLRKFIGRQPVTLAANELLNLLAAYRRLCERIEAEAEIERQKLLALKDEPNAAFESALLSVVFPNDGTDCPPLPKGEGR